MASNNEEIIERKEGSPVATSCLVLACIAIIGAISLQIAEITQVRADWTLGEERTENRVIKVGRDKEKMLKRIDAILDKSDLSTAEDTESAKAEIKEADEVVKEAIKPLDPDLAEKDTFSGKEDEDEDGDAEAGAGESEKEEPAEDSEVEEDF